VCVFVELIESVVSMAMVADLIGCVFGCGFGGLIVLGWCVGWCCWSWGVWLVGVFGEVGCGLLVH